MPDARFFESAPSLSLADIVEVTGAVLMDGNPGLKIETAAPLIHADERSVAFLADPKYRSALAATRAGAVFLTERHADLAPAGCARLVTPAPQAAWADIARRLHAVRQADHRGEARPAQLEDGVATGPGVVQSPPARGSSGTCSSASSTASAEAASLPAGEPQP